MGRRAVRKGPKAGYRLCVGGPFHGERVQSEFEARDGRTKRLIARTPDRFRLPGYFGVYVLAPGREVYCWVDGTISLADHVRLLDSIAAKKQGKAFD